MSKRVVWKYPLDIHPLTCLAAQVHWIPEGAVFLHCAAQGNAIGLWYEVPDPDAEKVKHAFQLAGTGHGPIPDDWRYQGTAHLADGALVLHVFEVTD